MGWAMLVLLLFIFLGPGTAQGPDSGPRPRVHTESTQGPDTGPTPDPDPGPSPGSREARPVMEVRGLPEEEVRSDLRPLPVTDVSKLCVCDLTAEECDANCCCDPDCSPTDFSLFSTCTVPIVSGDDHFCLQKAAIYKMNFTAYPPERLFWLEDKVNPSLFCLYTLNYKAALSFVTPDFPNENNFDNFLKKSANFANAKESDISHPTILNASTATKYKYSVPVQTSDSFLKLPCPSVTNECLDNNPVGFLMDQVFQCKRSLILQQCGEHKALRMDQYSWPKILIEPNSSKEINITVFSIFVRNLNKTMTQLSKEDTHLQPTFVNISGLDACTNVVLKVKYLITFTETGEITKANVTFFLGTITSLMLPLQQQFEVQFLQQNVKSSFPLSGNPGYIIGQPLSAGSELESRIIQNSNQFGQFTILYGSTEQNCLETGFRKAILFGNDIMTGCKLRLKETMDCQVLSKRLIILLKGQNFPQFVSSFGNSPTQNLQDWVPVSFSSFTLKRQDPCLLPVLFDIKVKWTKYGSLMNPQSRIISVEAKMFSSSFPKSDMLNNKMIEVNTVVNFLDVSAPAEAGYKAKPSIDAKLPSNFFFPFV